MAELIFWLDVTADGHVTVSIAKKLLTIIIIVMGETLKPIILHNYIYIYCVHDFDVK